MDSRPQVLLLGNGLNIAFGGVSWSGLLKSISVRNDIPDELHCPMPLQAMLYTNNDIKSAMNKKKGALFGCLATAQQRNVLLKLLSMSFDEILTTNYSYELEMAAFGTSFTDDKPIIKLAAHTSKVERVEQKYLLHSYNRVVFNGNENRIWHIHGEARKPDSMILGHYYYANLLGRMIDYIKENENRYERNAIIGKKTEIYSWLDAFILGDVYVLGYSFNVSEFDLWWLLNRKLRENAPHGKVYFFEPYCKGINGFNEKIELMKLLDVEPHDCGFIKPEKDDPQYEEKYREFYGKALELMDQKIEKNKYTFVGG